MIQFRLNTRSGVPTYLQLVQQVRQAIMLGLRVEHRQSTATGMTRDLDQHLVASFGDVNRHENESSRIACGLVMVGPSPE